MITIQEIKDVYHIDDDGDLCRDIKKANQHSKNGSVVKIKFTQNHHSGSCMIYSSKWSMQSHRLIMSLHLDRVLVDGEHVYHLDKNKLNNNINNLILVNKKSHPQRCPKTKQNSIKIGDVINGLTVVEKCKDDIIFNTKYGLCRRNIYQALKNNKIAIQSAINKTEYLKLYLKDVVGEDNYTYNNLVYNGTENKITITCKKYGDFDILLGNFMAGKGHPKMRLEKLSKSKSINYKDYTEKLSVIHSNNYDYIDTGDYVNSRSIITAVCKEHGEFKIRAIDHYSGNGCQKCGRISIQNKNKENPTGWSYSNWESAAKRSSRFDSYKVYFLECWDPDTLEKFYKIGRTFLSIKDRFVGKHNLPYKFNILYYIELPNARDICILENKYKTIHKDLKYTPTKKFCGVNECYTNIIYI